MSDTRTPIRPDLAREWTGQSLTSQAGALQWNHTTTRLDVSAAVKDVGELFRAEAGFVPQVGFRQWSGEAGWTLRPSGFVSKLRPFVSADRQTDRDGALIARGVRPGIALNTAWNGMVMLHYLDDEIRAGNSTIGRRQLGYAAQISPSRLVSIVGISGATGQQIDFVSARPGTGTTLNVAATLNPTNHFSVALTEDQSWVNVDNSASARQRLFLARVSRVRGTYTFTSRMFVRATVQYVSTTREPGLYPVAVPEQEGAVSGQLLLSYKLNWQSVLFVGYGDDRTLSMQDRFEKTGRQLFVKLSYAVQR